MQITDLIPMPTAPTPAPTPGFEPVEGSFASHFGDLLYPGQDAEAHEHADSAPEAGSAQVPDHDEPVQATVAGKTPEGDTAEPTGPATSENAGEASGDDGGPEEVAGADGVPVRRPQTVHHIAALPTSKHYRKALISREMGSPRLTIETKQRQEIVKLAFSDIRPTSPVILSVAPAERARAPV